MDVSELIKEAKVGIAASQKCLFDMFADKMLLVGLRYVKSSQDAEEIVLDAFLKFFKSLASFDYKGEAALYTWLKKIVINECLMRLRKTNVFSIVAEIEAEDVTLDENILDALSAEEILSTIRGLPNGYRTVFNLNVIEGFNHKEIGQLLNISEGTSKSQLFKAKSLLQRMIIQNNSNYGHRKNK
jgi:RNA polymerase sigma-70 factor (ECF subfamily)